MSDPHGHQQDQLQSQRATSEDAPDGRRVYENRFVIWGRMSWGRLREYEVYEDTDKPEALDEFLREQRPALAG